MKALRCIPMAAALLAAGCQTWGPTWSEISGDRYTRIDPDRRPAFLVRVGDKQNVGNSVLLSLRRRDRDEDGTCKKHNARYHGDFSAFS